MNNISHVLSAIVGVDNVSVKAADLRRYSRDQSFTPPCQPDCVVWPGRIQEVQEIVRLANKQRIPVIPFSSGSNYHGGCVPTSAGIVVDLRRLNSIINIDERNWNALIEPGVTFSRLQEELSKRNLRVATPLTSPPSASILVDYIERNPVVTAADFVFGNELFNTYDIVMPSGDLFTVGHPPTEKARSMAPDGPALDFYRLFMGAQGTLGIVVRMSIRLLPFPAAQNVYFIPAKTAGQAVDIIQSIERKEIGLECFALNNFNLAALAIHAKGTERAPGDIEYVTEYGAKAWTAKTRARFEKLRDRLPQWTVVLCLTGWARRADEKIEYQRADLSDTALQHGFEVNSTVADIAGLDNLIKEEVITPWRLQRRFGFKGSCHGLMFHARPDLVSGLETEIQKTAHYFKYSSGEIGGYMIPIERGRTMYCEFDFHCSAKDTNDRTHIEKLFLSASKTVLDNGGFFDRPYGIWAELMYSRSGTYIEYLKRIKRKLDPNNIMNPGKLCF